MKGCLGARTHTKAPVTGAAQRALCPCTPPVLGVTRAIQPWALRTLHRPAQNSPGLRSQAWPPVMDLQSWDRQRARCRPGKKWLGQGLTASNEEEERERKPPALSRPACQ